MRHEKRARARWLLGVVGAAALGAMASSGLGCGDEETWQSDQGEEATEAACQAPPGHGGPNPGHGGGSPPGWGHHNPPGHGGGAGTPCWVHKDTPRILTSEQSRAWAEPGNVVLFKIVASDPNGLPLTYSWSATQGTVARATPQGDEAFWTAPFVRGAIHVTVHIQNTRGLRATRKFRVFTWADLESAVYVGGSGAGGSSLNVSSGSIQQAVDTAVGMGLTNVVVAAGTYHEKLTLPAGMTVWGGYDPSDWHHVPGSLTQVISSDRIGLVVSGEVAGGLGAGGLDGISVEAADAPPGHTSIAVVLDHLTDIYSIRGVSTFKAGASGDEGAGDARSPRAKGGEGGVEGDFTGPGGGGGPGDSGSLGGAEGGLGGRGGSGLFTGGNQAGEGGGNGQEGRAGRRPLNQSDGEWFGSYDWHALAGGPAGDGGGGGGGGGGGSGLCCISPLKCAPLKGGKGGPGGKGGQGGQGGGGAGGSIGLLILHSDEGLVDASNGILTIRTGPGGTGGAGRAGTAGDDGEDGKEGVICFIVAGGRGGHGGQGNGGGGGAGGGGGMSVGVYVSNSIKGKLWKPGGINTTYSTGAAGAGGPGGAGGGRSEPRTNNGEQGKGGQSIDVIGN